MTDTGSASRALSVNVLALRKKKGLSQEQLSQHAQIPRSTITHMESGSGNPSLANLCKLAAALSVSIEELLSQPRSECSLIPSSEVPVLSRGGGKVLLHKLMPDKVRGIEIDRIELQPQASMGGKPHLVGSKEYLTTLTGVVVVSLSGNSYSVTPGDVLAFPGDQKHAYRNGGAKLAIALSVVLPLPFILNSE